MHNDFETQKRLTADLGSAQLSDTALRMGAADGAAAQLRILSDDLTALTARLAEAAPEAETGLGEALARNAGQVASAMDALKQNCRPNDIVTMDAAIDLSSGLSGLGGVLVAIVDTFRMPCKTIELPADMSAERVMTAVERTRQLAIEMDLVAGEIYRASGVGLSNNTTVFRHPKLSAGCCGQGGGSDELDTASNDGTAAPVPYPFDEELLTGNIQLIEAFARVLIELLTEVAILISAFLVITCDNDCTMPGTFTASLATSGARSVSGGFQAFIQIDWDYCCENWCWLFWKDRFIEAATPTIHDVGTTVAVGRERAAKRLAAKLGTEAIADIENGATPVLAGKQVKPAIKPPAPPDC